LKYPEILDTSIRRFRHLATQEHFYATDFQEESSPAQPPFELTNAILDEIAEIAVLKINIAKIKGASNPF
jgi:hypothetical protein